MRRVVWSSEAEAELEAAFDASAERWGLEQTLNYFVDLRQACERIAEQPWLGQSRDDIPEPYLALVVGRHILVYRYTDESVIFAAVFHGAMDIRSRFREILRRLGAKRAK